MQEKTYNMLAIIATGVVTAATSIFYINQLDKNIKRYQQELTLLKEEEVKQQQERKELDESLNSLLEEYSNVAAEKLVEVKQQKEASAPIELQHAAKALQQVGFFSATLSLEDKCDLAEQAIANFKQAEHNEALSDQHKQQLNY